MHRRSDFKRWIGEHEGSKFVVVGCGESAKLAKDLPSDIITIGVNDVPKLFTPNYLVVIDSPEKFKVDNRIDIVKGNKCEATFTQIEKWKLHNQVNFTLGSNKLGNLKSGHKIDFAKNSPYVATIIAYKMGAKTVGYLGNDFAQNHFYKKDGDHNLIRANKRAIVERSYEVLSYRLNMLGCPIYTLSEANTISTLKYKSISDFINE